MTTPHTTTPQPNARATYNGQIVDALEVISVGYHRGDPAGSSIRIQLSNGSIVRDMWPDRETASKFAVELADSTKYKHWLFTSCPQWVATSFISNITYRGPTDVRVTMRSGEAISDHWYSREGRDMWIRAAHMSMNGSHGEAIRYAEWSRIIGDPAWGPGGARYGDLPEWATRENAKRKYDAVIEAGGTVGRAELAHAMTLHGLGDPPAQAA